MHGSPRPAFQSDRDAGERLAGRALELVDIPSVSRNEAALAHAVAGTLDGCLPLRLHADDCLFFCRSPAAHPLVVFAGHLDTVPPQGNLPGRLDESAVHGLGASDMKGGLAVMIELARWCAGRPLALHPGFLFFSREELPVSESPIAALLAAEPLLREADLVVVMEPTNNAVQLGCLGNLNADATFRGVSAHSARPWLGENAIHKAVRALQRIAAQTPRSVTVDGLAYTEVVSVTQIEGGLARNIVPDKVTCGLNLRYAPGRTPEDAEAELRALLGDDAIVSVSGNAPPGRVAIDNQLVTQLKEATSAPVEPKQAWTNVAEFNEAGIDAINFGPGDPTTAHRPDEHVAIAALYSCFDGLCRFLQGVQQ
jgi:succinyl-diaminopimelate desuccinylase